MASAAIQAFANDLVDEFREDPLLGGAIYSCVVKRPVRRLEDGLDAVTYNTISDSTTYAADLTTSSSQESPPSDVSHGQKRLRYMVFKCPQVILEGDLIEMDNSIVKVEEVLDSVRANAIYDCRVTRV